MTATETFTPRPTIDFIRTLHEGSDPVANAQSLPLPLAALAERAFAAFDHATAESPELVVTPAVPILYFGDAVGYRKSNRKVVTVGLNPSLAEFPVGDPFLRFPRCVEGRPDSAYLAGLDAYFHEGPYKRWFNTFSGLLHGLDASFYADRSSIALHTDLGSPIATNPTWSKLSKQTTAQLGGLGTPLWHDLIGDLRPDVILASVAWKWMERIEFPGDRWWNLHSITENHKNPYMVKARRMKITDDHSALLVWGQAAQTPFGTLSYAHKVQVGQLIKGILDGR